MKVYIATDLEGATGVVDYDYGDVMRRRKDRNFLMSDINAAVAGAYDAGAKAVVVYDGHGRSAVQMDNLDPRATLIRGGRPECYLPGLGGSFTHLGLVGAHSMAGAGGLLSHTFSHRVRRIILNGKEIGEIGLSLTYANYYGVKPVFMSGDDKAVTEAKVYVPDINAVTVKRSISERCGECLTPQLTYQLIRDSIIKGLSSDKSFSADLPSSPYEMEVAYKRPWVALPRYLIRGRFDGVSIKNFDTIVYRDGDFSQIMKKFFGRPIQRPFDFRHLF